MELQSAFSSQPVSYQGRRSVTIGRKRKEPVAKQIDQNCGGKAMLAVKEGDG